MSGTLVPTGVAVRRSARLPFLVITTATLSCVGGSSGGNLVPEAGQQLFDQQGLAITLSDGSPIVLPRDCSSLQWQADTLKQEALRSMDRVYVKRDSAAWQADKRVFTEMLDRARQVATTASLRCQRAKARQPVDRQGTEVIWEALHRLDRAVASIPDTVEYGGRLWFWEGPLPPGVKGLPRKELSEALYRESSLPATEALKGHLVLAPKNDPLPEMLVLLTGGSAEANTWARSYFDGWFVFPGLGSGDYEVILYGPVTKVPPIDQRELVRLYWRQMVRLEAGNTKDIVVPATAAEWSSASSTRP